MTPPSLSPSPLLPFGSVRTRLTLWNTLVVALLLAVFGATLVYMAQVKLTASVDNLLLNDADHYLAMARMPPPPGFGGPGHPGGGPGGPGGPHGPEGFGHREERGPRLHGPDDGGYPGAFGAWGSGVLMDSWELETPPLVTLLQTSRDEPGIFTARIWRQPQDGQNPQDPTAGRIRRPPSTPAEAREERAIHQADDSSNDTAAASGPLMLSARVLFADNPGPGMGPDGGRVNPPWDAVSLALSWNGQSRFSTIQVDGEPVRVYSAPLRRDGRTIGVVQLAATLTETQQEVGRLVRNLLTLFPFALAAVVVTGIFLTGRALRPVLQITVAAENIGAKNLSGRLPVQGTDEFARLATTFNGMLARLEKAFDRQRRFTADASHELRTPLTVIKTNTSLALSADREPEAYRRALTMVDQAADMMRRTVEDLLFLARADADRIAPERQRTLLDEVLEIAVGTVRGPERACIFLESEDSSLAVLGDRFDLVRLFTNLLTNAVRHTPPGGRVCVTAHAAAGGRVLIEVADTGEGIAPEHLAHVFEPFFRVDTSRSRAQGGTGLGLAISRAIAEAHGGTLTLDSILHQGTVARVTLPEYGAGAVE